MNEKEIFVSKIKTGAFKTIEEAKQYIRTLPKDKYNITVNIDRGVWEIEDTIYFGKEDSENPVVYKGVPGTVLFGGKRLTGFKKLEHIPENMNLEIKDKVYVCDLKENGINKVPLLSVRGMAQEIPYSTIEIYENENALSLSSYPKKGYLSGDCIDSGEIDGSKPAYLKYTDDYLSKFKNEKDLWLFGYFAWRWADGTIKVSQIDTENKQFVFDKPYNYRGTPMDNRQGIIFYAFNVLSELSFGEYYIDRENLLLYIIPKTGLDNIEVSILSKEMLHIESGKNIRFENITFDMGQSRCVLMKNCQNVVFDSCHFKRFAHDIISINGGFNCEIINSEIENGGRKAIELIGGDRETLTGGGHKIINNSIHDYGRIDKAVNPGINCIGCGFYIAHNEIFNCPAMAVFLFCNDAVFEYNYIHDVSLDVDDSGAVDMFYNCTHRGVVIRYNYFENVGFKDREPVIGQAAIRLDDCICDVHIFGNIFKKCASGIFGAVQINSGKDNVIENNIIIDCPSGFSGGFNPLNPAWEENMQNADGTTYINELYLEKYPKLKSVFEKTGGNFYKNNIFVNTGEIFNSKNYIQEQAESCHTILNDIGKDFMVNVKKFEKIPFKKIGRI